MEGGDILQVVGSALLLVLTLSGPLLLTALLVGVAVGLLQALTQIQEMTLTFVPKLLAMGGVLLLSLPAMGEALGSFMAMLSDKMIAS